MFCSVQFRRMRTVALLNVRKGGVLWDKGHYGAIPILRNRVRRRGRGGFVNYSLVKE